MHGGNDRIPAGRPAPVAAGARTGPWPTPLVLAAGFVVWLLGSPPVAQAQPAQAAPPAQAGSQATPPAQTGARGAPAKGGTDATFRVLIHADNPTAELPADKIARMFLKKVKRWDHDVLVLPIDLGLRDPIRKDFTRSVHGKSVTAINSFWQRMIFGRGEVPPPAVSSEQEVLDFVRANPGAIGYVAAETELLDGVKELKITP